MADKISRRSFLKGTGKTILTAGVLSSGVGLSTSTTPTTVIPKVLKAPPRLLSPKARAYRSFLKGIVGGAEMYQKHRPTGRLKTSVKSVLTKHSEYNPKTGNIERVKTSYGRNAFETAIKKPDKALMQGKLATNSGASNLAISMKTNTRELKQGFMDPKNTTAGKETRTLASRITRAARQLQADEIKAYRARRQKLVERGLVDKRKNTKIKGAKVGGGGKMALPGLESAKNPTGMSLITQRYTL